MKLPYLIFIQLFLFYSCSLADIESAAIRKELRNVNEEIVKGREVAFIFLNHTENSDITEKAKKTISKQLREQFNNLGYEVVPDISRAHLLIKVYLEKGREDQLQVSLYGDVQEWSKRSKPFFEFINLSYQNNKKLNFNLEAVPVHTYKYYQRKIRKENIFVARSKKPGCFFTAGFIAKCLEGVCRVREIRKEGLLSKVKVDDELISFNGFGASYVINNSAYDFVYSGRKSVDLKIKRNNKEVNIKSPLFEYCVDKSFFQSN